MRIETRRLVLRPMTQADFDALYAVLADADTMRHYPRAFDAAMVREWIDRNMDRYRAFGFGLWAVCLRDTGEVIGDCGLTMQLIHGQIRPEIGYHIRKDRQRRGYAKEAASAVRDWAFENTPFNTLYSYMKHTNVPSSGTAIAFGCRQVEEYADDANALTKVFAITREEWRASFCAAASRNAMPRLERIDDANRKAVDAFIRSHWFTLQMAVHGEMIDLGVAEGFIASEDDRILGLITYRVLDDALEILSLDSTEENRGIGSALLDEAILAARRRGCESVVLTTTNDNTRALRFYQRRGFDLIRLNRDAVAASRKLKPEIPTTGIDGIPLRHEIDLRLTL